LLIAVSDPISRVLRVWLYLLRLSQDPWMVVSVADNNMLQMWQMASHIYNEDDDGPDVPTGRLE